MGVIHYFTAASRAQRSGARARARTPAPPRMAVVAKRLHPLLKK